MRSLSLAVGAGADGQARPAACGHLVGGVERWRGGSQIGRCVSPHQVQTQVTRIIPSDRLPGDCPGTTRPSPHALRRGLRQGGSVRPDRAHPICTKAWRAQRPFTCDYTHKSTCSSPDVHGPGQWWLCCVGCSTCSLNWLPCLVLDRTSAGATEQSSANDCGRVHKILNTIAQRWTSQTSRQATCPRLHND
jgi:hypothetical protein